MRVELQLLERWLSGWSLARGLPLPQRADGGLVAEVGWPEQLRRHVFVDAGAASGNRDLRPHRNVAGDAERLLVATAEGRALYLSLGWRELAPYSTAVLAEGQPGDDREHDGGADARPAVDGQLPADLLRAFAHAAQPPVPRPFS